MNFSKLKIFTLFCLEILFISTYGQQESKYALELEFFNEYEEDLIYHLEYFEKYCLIDGQQYNFTDEDDFLIQKLNNIKQQTVKYIFLVDSITTNNNDFTVSSPQSVKACFIYNDHINEISFKIEDVELKKVKNQILISFFDIVFYLDKTKQYDLSKTSIRINEIEQRQLYPNPIIKISEDPLKYKLINRFYWDIPFYELFEGLRYKEKVTIEIGKFFELNQYDKSYDYIVNDLFKRDNIKWIVHEKNYNNLIMNGLPKSHIIKVIKK